jgi:hypothetical protein
VTFAKRERFVKKIFLCVWWNYECLTYYELVPDGRTINAEIFSQQLEKNLFFFARKVPSASQPKARVTSGR